ncbi:hypothetical protein AB6A40_005897 [Gnathostoma spinigerum]|uniref:Uncharacterized protein n=1 Tax=Gnathostoma spinigerum TaxID=75299 RepID=A0ABD6EGZ8_9BILA
MYFDDSVPLCSLVCASERFLAIWSLSYVGFIAVDSAIKAIQADPSNLEAARALLSNLNPIDASSVIQLMAKRGVLSQPVISALKTMCATGSVGPESGGVKPFVQSQLKELLSQLVSLENKKADDGEYPSTSSTNTTAPQNLNHGAPKLRSSSNSPFIVSSHIAVKSHPLAEAPSRLAAASSKDVRLMSGIRVQDESGLQSNLPIAPPPST